MITENPLFYTAVGRAAILSGVFLLVGAAATTWLAPMRTIRRPLWLAALLLLLGLASQAVGQLMNFDAFAPDAEPLGDLVAIIATTSWAQSRAALTVLVVMIGVGASLNGRWLDFVARSTAMAALCTLPFLGHAASAEPAWLSLPLAVVHALAASVWIGTLALLGPAWWNDVQAAVQRLPHYGRTALFAAPVAVLSGGVTAWTRLESPMQLLSTDYGRLLIIKTILVLSVLALGARHHRQLTRYSGASLLGADRVQLVRRTLQLEVVLAVIVLLLTGWLGESAPPTLD